MMKEYGEIESDLKIVQQLCKWSQFEYVETACRASKQRKIYFFFVADQATKLRCPHKELDDALKSLLGNLSKQVTAELNVN